jgi:hypothetical protein
MMLGLVMTWGGIAARPIECGHSVFADMVDAGVLKCWLE